MNRESIPPLLRGLGTSIVLVAGIISILLTRAKMTARSPQHRAIVSSAQTPSPLDQLTRDVAELRADAEDDVIEEVLDNPWFECFSLFGTAVIASSFFVEWSLKKRVQ